MSRVLQGDLGRSLRSRRQVLADVLDALPNTIELTLVAALITPVVAIPLGVVAAARRRTPVDTSLMMVSMLGITLPPFALALGLMWLFAYQLRWFPISGDAGPLWTLDGLRSVFLPALTLAIGSVATLARLTRSAMLEVLARISCARARQRLAGGLRAARGTGWPTHCCPWSRSSACRSRCCSAGPSSPRRSSPGRVWVGWRSSPSSRATFRVQGAVLVIAVLFVLMNLAVDVLYAYVDPRIHYG